MAKTHTWDVNIQNAGVSGTYSWSWSGGTPEPVKGCTLTLTCTWTGGVAVPGSYCINQVIDLPSTATCNYYHETTNCSSGSHALTCVAADDGVYTGRLYIWDGTAFVTIPMSTITVGSMAGEICEWVTANGGPCHPGTLCPTCSFCSDKILVLIHSKNYQTPPPGYTFIPNSPQIIGCIAYKNGNVTGGNTGTGCELT